MSSTSHLKSLSIALSLVPGLVVTGFTFQAGDKLAPVKVSKIYTSDDFGTIESVGACNVTPDTISCWDASGVPDANLSEKVKAFYIVDSNAEIRHKFGRKNRLLVLKRPANGYGAEASMFNFKTASGGYLNSAGQIGQNGQNHEAYLEWFAYDGDPTDTTASVQFDIDFQLGSGIVPLKEGADGQVGSMKVHINSIKPSKERQSWGPVPVKQKTWTVSISLSGYTGSVIPSVNGNVQDRKGVRIGRVDASGNPMSEAWPRNGFAYASQPPAGYDASTQVIGGMGTPNLELQIVVNPTKASALYLSASGSRKVTITDIPLDPK